MTNYPSPKSTLTLNSHLSQNCDLGRGRPVSYLKISNHPTFLLFLIKNGGVGTRNMKNCIVDSCLFLGVSWCCGNYCLLAFVLWCGYCSVSFQSFVLRHWCPQHQETTLFLCNLPAKQSVNQRPRESIEPEVTY